MREATELPKKVVSKGHEIAKSLIKHRSKVSNPYAVGMATAKKSAGIKEEADLDEAVKTGNEGHGYHGNVKAKDDAERAKHYSAMHAKTKKLVGAAGHLKDARHPNKMVKHFLDSPHGRHIADDPSDRNITSRFGHFKKSYKPHMHEEAEQVDEVLDTPMKKLSYTMKAYKQIKNADPIKMANNPKAMRQVVNRTVGVARVNKKLTKKD